MPMSHRDLWKKIQRETKGKTPAEELAILERYLSDWPEFKGPYQEMRKKFERRIVELRKIEQVRASSPTHHDPFSVRKRGLAEVAIVGLPNTGKSSLFRSLTGVEAEVADYPYTTLIPNVGMLNLGGFGFEIVDLPPVPDGPLETVPYAAGLKEAVLNANLLCLVVDLGSDAESQIEVIRERLAEIGASPTLTPGTEEGGAGDSGGSHVNRKGTIVFGTKRDQAAEDDLEALRRLLPRAAVFEHPLAESAARPVAEALCRFLGRIVVLARDPDAPDEPLAYAVSAGATVLDLAEQIHKELASKARKGRVWGASAKFPGQEVGLDHRLEEGDTVEILTH